MQLQQLYDYLAAQDADYLYAVVRDWNWSHGTWLLSWIASQPTCTRATAQRIFWACEPETFLPHGEDQPYEDADVRELAALVLRSWQAGLYPPDPQSLGERLRALRGGRFRSDDGTWYAPGQIGFLDPANPMPAMASYRAAEARCDPAALPWAVPDDLGRVQRERRPSWTAYDLVEGMPEEFLELLDEQD